MNSGRVQVLGLTWVGKEDLQSLKTNKDLKRKMEDNKEKMKLGMK